MTVIVSALRSPVGRYGGSLKNTSPEELVSILMKNNLSSVGLDTALIDEVIVGHTKQSAHNPNIARLGLLKAEIPEHVPGHTVHMQCGSGMQAIMNGAMSITAGKNEVVLAGGVEIMSQAPYYFVNNRFGIQPGDLKLSDANIESQPKSQPEEFYGKFSMGVTAERLAKKYHISRQEQDEFALNSQMKAKKAMESGKFSEEIVPITVKEGKKDFRHFAVDEHPRDTNLEKLANLKPAFQEGGTVTAGNATGRNDGAAMLLLMSERKAHELGLKPLAHIRSFASAGVDPKIMGIGPVPATEKALRKAGLHYSDIDLIELNEAFAAQSLAVLREWGSDGANVNVNGGAIALGHPLGATGARILTTLISEMNKGSQQFGLATMCIAGGQGISMVVERK
ncbi:thiolase family protein [Virgibacillus sp. W0181]|uniref:thiolase family protein n=1 Tax=Virgibacillus sp. W0181 TaxID=3391581 RepID=UPI003F456F86